jgi:hypothetical protein
MPNYPEVLGLGLAVICAECSSKKLLFCGQCDKFKYKDDKKSWNRIYPKRPFERISHGTWGDINEDLCDKHSWGKVPQSKKIEKEVCFWNASAADVCF